MDLLYIINKNKSFCDNWELRFSLRSLEKFAKGIDKIYVAGVCPDFLNPKEVIIVEYKQDETHNKYEDHIQIDKTIKYVLDNYDISEDFLISMDDHYLLKEVDFNNYPYYVRDIKESGIYLYNTKNGKGGYHDFIVDTNDFLKKNNLSTYGFTLHKNMKLNRSIYLEYYNKFPEVKTQGLESFAACLNYQYSKQPFEFKIVEDCKLSNKTYQDLITLDYESFSSYDMVDYCCMFKAMQQLYPNKSKYEL